MVKREKTSGVTWGIRVTRLAFEMLDSIKDAKTRAAVVKVIDGLATNPEAQGKQLIGSLSGYRSIRAAGQRYRIIFKVERDKVIVYVVAAGIRKYSESADIYELARKLVRSFKTRS